MILKNIEVVWRKRNVGHIPVKVAGMVLFIPGGFTEKENLALNKQAFQRSNEFEDRGLPSAAVDGIDNPDFGNASSCIVTLAYVHVWWAVDLQAKMYVSSVTITSRSDAPGKRFWGFGGGWGCYNYCWGCCCHRHCYYY